MQCTHDRSSTATAAPWGHAQQMPGPGTAAKQNGGTTVPRVLSCCSTTAHSRAVQNHSLNSPGRLVVEHSAAIAAEAIPNNTVPRLPAFLLCIWLSLVVIRVNMQEGSRRSGAGGRSTPRHAPPTTAPFPVLRIRPPGSQPSRVSRMLISTCTSQVSLAMNTCKRQQTAAV